MFGRSHGLVVAVAALLAASLGARAATYRSHQTGNWNSTSTWEIYVEDDPPRWDQAQTGQIPTTGDTATVQSSHTVTVSDTRSVATLTVNSSGVIVVANGGTLTASSLSCTGTNSGVQSGGTMYVTSLTLASSAIIACESGGLLALTGSSPTASVPSGCEIRVWGEFRVTATSGTPTVTVSSGGLINVRNYGSMNLASAGATVDLDGAITLDADHSERPRLLASADASLSGSGIVRGLTPDARIQIGPSSGSGSATLSSAVTLASYLTISRNLDNSNGVANFDNRGVVKADAPGVSGVYPLTLDSTLSSITDSASSSCSEPRWLVSAVSSSVAPVLTINASATGLHGNFAVAVDGGLMNIGANVQTDGLFTFDSGATVWVRSGYFNVTGTGGGGNGNHYCASSHCNSDGFPYYSYVYCTP